ncbi:multicopper oxidase domain-containing protein [Sporichthya polymorpha]|uniref:multicopper oxidase domain-containing protein n=1 Tax=Sporichthya polymorpha TaxID=35751 RepID=UPI0003611D39|nr:multicopper oxidase domain-containing protein [Sporichthya polymorpha]
MTGLTATGPTAPGPTATRGFWPLRDLPVVGWLIATVVVALVHPYVTAPRWLMIHLFLLGAVSHAILVWSRYFADALLHTGSGPAERREQSARLLLLNSGAATVVSGILTGRWVLTLVGATAVAGAVLWHGVRLARDLRHALGSRFAATVRFYVAAAALLPVGAGLGAYLARGLADPTHQQVLMAHVLVNVLGWVGLTVLGTLVTLWPTMLRTRIVAGAETAAARALPVLVGSILIAAGGAWGGQRLVAAAGVTAYVGGAALLARPFVAAARTKAPASYPTWSVLAGLLWFAGLLVSFAVAIGTASSWVEAGSRFRDITPFLAAGFAAQVLLGALSYLVPVALGGGATPTRAANTVLDRGSALRITVINAGLLLCILPVPSVVRVLASMLALAGLAAFLPLLVLAIRASRVAKRTPVGERPVTPGRPGRPAAERPPGQLTGLALTGLAVTALAVAGGVALDPSALPGATSTVAASAGVEPTGRTTTVAIQALDMRFVPDRIEVPAGDRLVIDLTNGDDDVHDLVLDSGDRSGRLSPGDTARLDIGVVGRALDGWCSVIGHRQMGMVLTVEATGLSAPSVAHPGHAVGPDSAAPGPSATDRLDLRATPNADFTPYDAVLPPLTDHQVRRHTFTVRDVVREVAPGVTQQLWTFNGTAPGPVLHGRVGDIFEITLVNEGTIGHSIDFHAGALAPDEPMRTITPGESLRYRFRAERAGVWMYHCSTMPMSAHIANGLFGAVVIEPPDLPAVDRSYLLVQSEFYLGPPDGPVDVDKLRAERPDIVAFNGYARQYDHRPLPARVGERVRIWVLDAGPNRGSSFHVVGGQFDTTYLEGSYTLRPGPGGSQTLALAPAQGGFVELVFPEPGHYPFVSHVMIDAERGAHGHFHVTD